jgi:hypothetical protein
MTALELVKLPPLMARTSGRREVMIGLIDGPIAKDHPDLRARTSANCLGQAGQVAPS